MRVECRFNLTVGALRDCRSVAAHSSCQVPLDVVVQSDSGIRAGQAMTAPGVASDRLDWSHGCDVLFRRRVAAEVVFRFFDDWCSVEWAAESRRRCSADVAVDGSPGGDRRG